MIYHLALRSDWEQARATGDYRVSTRGLSLDQVGFVHCSAGPEQTGRVARTFYADCAEPLCLLVIDPAKLRAEVVREPAAPGAGSGGAGGDGGDGRTGEDGGAELFPHVYGPIDLDAVVEVRDYQVPR